MLKRDELVAFMLWLHDNGEASADRERMVAYDFEGLSEMPIERLVNAVVNDYMEATFTV